MTKTQKIILKNLVNLRKYSAYLALVLACSITSSSQVKVFSQTNPTIPSPEEAALIAERLSPEELTQVNINNDIRDSLRSMPEWNFLLQEIRRELIIFKWGEAVKLENPVWERYGAKVYPLLAYYTNDWDSSRREYGLEGIRYLGKPYTTIWLEEHLKTGNKLYNFYLPKNVLEEEFGLDDPEVLDYMVELAWAGYDYESLPWFNKRFLAKMLGYKSVEDPDYRNYLMKEEKEYELSAWDAFESLTSINDSQASDLIEYFYSLSLDEKEFILIHRLGPIKAGEISDAGNILLSRLAENQNSPYRTWAIAELDRHGSSKGRELLKNIINNDLKELNSLTKLVDYDSPSSARLHAYLLLVNIAEKYPESRFIQGCIKYGDIRGMSYFGQAPRSKDIQDLNSSMSLTERVKAWQEWLNLYPDHPGADDAIYFLAQSLQEQNNILEATRYWIRLMIENDGDRDASEFAWPQLRSLIDVGLTIEQLQLLAYEKRNTAIEPILRYALAVRYARSQEYEKALQLTNGLDLSLMPTHVLGSYYKTDTFKVWHLSVDDIQHEMQTMLLEQRQRWKRLRNFQIEGTHESKYLLASSWAGSSGWKNGYLNVWDYFRVSLLPIADEEDCKIFWTCDLSKRDFSSIQTIYQKSNANYIALDLYQEIMEDPNTPLSIREKTLFMSASRLVAQLEYYPDRETIILHPMPGVDGKAKIHSSQQSDEDLEENVADGESIDQEYKNRIDELISQLKREFPESSYIDDLLFSSYFLSREEEYLNEILTAYPSGDRADEAKFLLEKIKSAH